MATPSSLTPLFNPSPYPTPGADTILKQEKQCFQMCGDWHNHGKWKLR